MSSAQAPGSPSHRGDLARTADGDDVHHESVEPREDPLLGKTLAGKYAIQALIGEGAMGRVYRARQLALDKQIAIKVLHRHLTGEQRIAKRFHREARAASRLSHPNSLHILDFGATEDGTLYIAMELLDGEDLQTILDHDFPLSPARIAALLVPVLRAVEEAHRAGIIHRDLKPDNVVVLSDRSGREHVKVCDFGIAKILDGEEGTSITVDGFVCGTPQYMAPEQARGEAIDHRSDIYAAGVVLYQMLCGKVPFTGENALGIITKHLMEEPVSPRRRRPELGIPKSLEDVCLRAMKKDPADRWPTASAMADALGAAVAALGRDAEQRLGEGSFRAPAIPDEPSAGAGEHVAVRRSPILQIAGALVITGLALGSAAWLLWGGPVDDGPSVVVPAAPPSVRPPVVAPPEPLREPETLPETVVVEPTVAPIAPQPAVEARVRPRRDPEPSEGAGSSPEMVSPEVPAIAPVADERSQGQVAFDDGRRLFLTNDVPGAIRSFEDAARLMPRNAEVQKQLGRAYMRAGDVTRGVGAYRRYLDLAPDAADRAVVARIIAQHGGG